MRTVSLHDEERRHEIASDEVRPLTWLARFYWSCQGWMLAVALGCFSALSGCLIEYTTEALASTRFGYCGAKLGKSFHHCPDGHWTSWGNGVLGFCASVGLGTVFAAISAFLVYMFAPSAAGSGIPETKVILNGFVLSDAVSLRTLLVKIPGLCLSVAGGMALGKEGPLVHVSMCWAQLLSRIFPQYQNEGKRRELFSAAAAAGVSTAFGAPIGGVLFSLEEVSSSFPTKTLLRAFTAAVVAALVLQVVNLTGSRRLTMFQSDYSSTIDPLEIFVFAILGAVGGLVGAAFNTLNVRWSAFRATPGFKINFPPVLEVTLIALVTAVSSWPLLKTRILSAEAISAMFRSCGNNPMTRVELGLCTEDGHYETADVYILGSLLGAAAIRFVQMTLTFGTKCPAGLFVPSLYIGACIGRATGIWMQYVNERPGWTYHRLNSNVEPGVYSMMGAAAVLGGVCRVTISLVVIMLELTDSLTYVVPFMVCILVAKLVGDRLTDGIYDMYIVLKGFPFLKEDINVTYMERCCDVMETRLTTLDVSLRPTSRDLRAMLHAFTYNGFPVVDAEHFVGYARRGHLESQLDLLDAEHGDQLGLSLDDLLPAIDCTVMRLVPDALLSQAHAIFKQLRVQHVFLVGAQGYRDGQHRDRLQGILSKKKFIRYLKSGRVGHQAQHPSSGPRDPSRAAAGALLPPSLPLRRWRSEPAVDSLTVSLHAAPSSDTDGSDNGPGSPQRLPYESPA